MRSAIAALALMPALAWAFTNSEKPSLAVATMQTVCLNAKDLTSLIDEFKEIPYVRGVSSPIISDGVPLSLVIFVNPKDRSFTIAERADKDRYCILAVGNGFEPVPQHIQDEVKTEQEQGRL